MSTERPLVSFCLLFYNHRQYFEAALEGAFAQTYRPLEIVISDDGSTDGSAELVQNYVTAHAPFDITIVFNHNAHNLGILGNWTKAASLSHGELLFMVGGDDISLPDRAEKVVAAWMADDKRAVSDIVFVQDCNWDKHLGHAEPVIRALRTSSRSSAAGKTYAKTAF